MKRKMLKSAAVLGTVGLASLLLVACGSKTSNSSSSDGKNITAYVEKQYEGYMKKAAAAFEKETGKKLLLRQVTNLKVLKIFHLTTNLARLQTL